MNIYKANIIYTPTSDEFRYLQGGYVCVAANGVVDGVYERLPEEIKDYSFTDFGDRLLIPAFNDLHIHAPQYRNLGLALDEELLPWLEKYTFPEEARFADIVYAERIYRRFVHELWMQGTMRSSVFATVHTEATELLMRLFRESGMGAYIGLVAMDRNSPDYLRNTPEAVEAFFSKTAEAEGIVRPILTPRFIPSCTPQMLTAIGGLARSKRLPVQSHLSENRSEISWVRELEPEASCYADAYRRYGLLGQTPTRMANCCHSTDEEMQMLKDNDVVVVHCPTSNSNLASGIAPIRVFLNNGIRVALGSDISGGHHVSMLRVMQYAIQLSKLAYARSEGRLQYLSLSEAFYLATKAGGSFFGSVGSFEKGYDFDALVIDDSYLNYDHYDLRHRLQRFIYLGDDRDIKVRFCKGRQLLKPVI